MTFVDCLNDHKYSKPPKTFTQYKLKRTDAEGYRVCWLDRKVNIGVTVTLKGVEGKYKVLERYGDIDADKLDLNRKVVWYSLPKEK